MFFLAQATQEPNVIVSILSASSSLVVMIATFWLIPAAKAWLQKVKADRENAVEGSKNNILWRLKELIATEVAHTANTEIPRLAKKLQDEEITDSDKIHNLLKAYGNSVAARAVEFLREEGLQLGTYITPEYIDKLIDEEADRVNPFMGMPTSQALANPELRDLLVSKGTTITRAKISEQEIGSSPTLTDSLLPTRVF